MLLTVFPVWKNLFMWRYFKQCWLCWLFETVLICKVTKILNGKPLAAIGKLMICKTLATNGEEITNGMIGNMFYLQIIGNHW